MRMIIIRYNTAPIVKKDSHCQKSVVKPTSPPLRLTRHQQAVLDVLMEQPHSLSAQELHAVLRERQVIGLATVYRAVETLRVHGLIKSRAGASGEAFYSPINPDQHYLTCLQCGQSYPLDHCPVQGLEQHLQPSTAFKIYYHTLEFFGLCESCTAE